MPLALDTYFRGNSEEVAFCKAVGAGGNHLVVATPGGMAVERKSMLRLRAKELDPVLARFRAMGEGERGGLPLGGEGIEPPRRPVPVAPEGGLVIRGYCCYLELIEGGGYEKAKRYYYERNPDRWLAETQSDLLWLTADESRTLLPEEFTVGATAEASEAVRRRFFGTVGIEYMEGSVNSLPVRESELRLTVRKVEGDLVELWLEGRGEMGVAFDEHDAEAPRSRGCRVRVEGTVAWDRKREAFVRFDVAGAGEAWGNKMEYVRREISLPPALWSYGVAFELVDGDAPEDRLPPYNLLHYGGGPKAYWE